MLLCSGFEWPGRVARLKRDLSSDQTERRLQAVRLLAHYPASRAGDAVMLALEDEDARVRAEAARTAGRIRLRYAVPVLLDWLDAPEADARAAAARALEKLGDDRALEPLVRLLGDNSPEVRRAALGALAVMEAERALPPLLGRLQDDNHGVRLEAIRVAGEQGDGRAVLPLIGCTRDSQAEIRAAANAALGDIGDERALSALAAGLGDTSEPVRISAAAALGKLGQEAAIDALSNSLPGADARTATAMMAAAGNIAGDRARELLLEQLRHEELGPVAAGALVERARRASAQAGGPSPEASRVIEGLVQRMKANGEDRPTLGVVCDALLRISSFTSIRSATLPLLAALERERGRPAGEMLLALGATGSGQVLVPLLERLQPSDGRNSHAGRRDGGPSDRWQSDDRNTDQLLDALLLYFERAPADGRAADPLLAFLQSASGQQRLKCLSLLGAARCERAVPALVDLLGTQDRDLRLAAVRALGAIGDPSAAPALLEIVDGRHAAIRFEAARALGKVASEKELGPLIERLLAKRAVDRHAVLEALGSALGHLRAQGQLSPENARIALDALSRITAAEDERLAARAVDALAAWGDPAAAPVVGAQATSPLLGRRVGAVMALGHFDAPEVLGSLRRMTRKGPVQVLSAAAISIGEIGNERDVDGLLRMAERFRWPVPASASYALARLARRGELVKRSIARKLCRLARSREPYVRANLAVTMASLGAGACDQGPDPLRWLDLEHASAVRASAARWVRAAAVARRIPLDKAERALRKCADSDPEPAVARACRQRAWPPLDAGVDVYTYKTDGESLLRFKLVALRLSDQSVLVGYTDLNGHLRIGNAPAGGFKLEYPGLTPLEPME